MSGDQIRNECRRLAHELVAKIIELEADGAAFPHHAGGEDWWVVIEKAGDHTRNEFPIDLKWDSYSDGREWSPSSDADGEPS